LFLLVADGAGPGGLLAGAILVASKLSLFLAELKRRKVTRVAVVYALVGIGVVEAAQLLFDAFELPHWAFQLVAFLVILGYPVALVLAWALEVTPQGIQRTPDLTADQLVSHAPQRWSPSRRALAGASLVVVLALGYFAFFRGVEEPSAYSRVVVGVFRNATGDPDMDPVGQMAGQFITQGLQRTGTVQVVPWETALSSSLFVQDEVAARNIQNPVLALAAETGAGIVVSGSYYLEGGDLLIQADVTDPLGRRTFNPIEPVRGPGDSPSEVVLELERRVMGLLALHLDERLATAAGLMGDPPVFEAYEAFNAGLERFINRQWQTSLPHFRRALELDSTWVQPILYLALAHINLGDYSDVDSLLHLMGSHGSDLTAYQEAWKENLQAHLKGDREAALIAGRRGSEIAPGSKLVFKTSIEALRTNRPQEAVDALLSLDPDRGAMRGWMPYWYMLARAYHRLGDDISALEAARSCFERCPAWEVESYVDCRREGVMALAALGRLEELKVLLEEILQVSAAGFGRAALGAIETMKGRRNEAGAVELLSFVLPRVDNALAETDWTDPSTETPVVVLRLLFVAGRIEEARAQFDQVVNARDLIRARAFRGFIAASTGDTTQAMEDLSALEEWSGPYLDGSPLYWQASITGALGDRDRALELIRQAHSEGLPITDLEGPPTELAFFRDYGPFLEFMRPKG
jgi:tetratricopeptide (TPR) repeat protein